MVDASSIYASPVTVSKGSESDGDEEVSNNNNNNNNKNYNFYSAVIWLKPNTRALSVLCHSPVSYWFRFYVYYVSKPTHYM